MLWVTASPKNLLAEGVRDARGRAHDGMLSDLRPLFDKIDKYYNEVTVSLRVEEECLNGIRNSLNVTADDRRRWEHIRDACKEASNLLISETPLPPPQTPQPIQNNKAARNIKTLARTINDAHHSLLHTNANVARLTQQPQFALLRLQSEYESGEQMCRQRIGEVLQFSEHFLRSFVEVPRLDRFRDHLLPTAADSSSHILHGVVELVRSSADAVVRALPQLKDHFARFESCFPIADTSMQHMYGALRGLVRPLEQPYDPHEGVLRRMRPKQLREEQHNFRNLGERWGNHLSHPRAL